MTSRASELFRLFQEHYNSEDLHLKAIKSSYMLWLSEQRLRGLLSLVAFAHEINSTYEGGKGSLRTVQEGSMMATLKDLLMLKDSTHNTSAQPDLMIAETPDGYRLMRNRFSSRLGPIDPNELFWHIMLAPDWASMMVLTQNKLGKWTPIWSSPRSKAAV